MAAYGDIPIPSRISGETAKTQYVYDSPSAATAPFDPPEAAKAMFDLRCRINDTRAKREAMLRDLEDMQTHFQQLASEFVAWLQRE